MQEYELTFSDGLKILAKSHHTIRLFHPLWINGDHSDFNAGQLMAIAGTHNNAPLTTKANDFKVNFQEGVFALRESGFNQQTLVSVERLMVCCCPHSKEGEQLGIVKECPIHGEDE